MSISKKPLELYTHSVEQDLTKQQWKEILAEQQCTYLGRKCIKTRKSDSSIAIGTCTVSYQGRPVVICPVRFLQRRQIFIDTIHLLQKHTPGNQLHVVPEITIPGGNVDFFVASVHRGEIKDYLGLEIQTMDTTGTVWPSRQQVIKDILGEDIFDLAMPGQTSATEATRANSYGMNWKMTAKTILVQMHHKVETLELLGKKLVLVVQDAFYNYVNREFNTEVLREAETADSAHFHVYSLVQEGDNSLSLEMALRQSTTTVGIEKILGLRHNAEIPEEDLLAKIQAKIGDATLLNL